MAIMSDVNLKHVSEIICENAPVQHYKLITDHIEPCSLSYHKNNLSYTELTFDEIFEIHTKLEAQIEETRVDRLNQAKINANASIQMEANRYSELNTRSESPSNSDFWSDDEQEFVESPLDEMDSRICILENGAKKKEIMMVRLQSNINAQLKGLASQLMSDRCRYMLLERNYQEILKNYVRVSTENEEILNRLETLETLLTCSTESN
ncbi:MAG: hypothetical protein KAS12_04060 [Candidatus Aenigmarchaeota archaeon]|nr:hypothetical protein [Candidatus Aenigmarchaeota archaeon]